MQVAHMLFMLGKSDLEIFLTKFEIWFVSSTTPANRAILGKRISKEEIRFLGPPQPCDRTIHYANCDRKLTSPSGDRRAQIIININRVQIVNRRGAISICKAQIEKCRDAIADRSGAIAKHLPVIYFMLPGSGNDNRRELGERRNYNSFINFQQMTLFEADTNS